MNDFGDTQKTAQAAPATNGLGAHVATVAAVLMLVGVAVAVHAWTPAGGARDTIVLWIMGVAVWSWLFLVMRLSAERTVFVVAIVPAAVFLTALVGLMQLTEADRPESIQPIAETAPERGGDADRG